MKKTGAIITIAIFSLMIFILGFNYREKEVPNEYYQVYLDDELIGTIKSKDELNKYIEKEGEKVKENVKNYNLLLDYNCKTEMTSEEREKFNEILENFREEYKNELKLLEKDKIINNFQTDSLNCVNGLLSNNEKYILNNYILKHQIYLYADQINEPNGLQVRKFTTYNNKVMSVEDIYDKIAEKSSFTVEGYKITIKSHEKNSDETIYKEIYVKDEEIFKKAVESMIKTFLGENDYNAYYNNTQEKIQTVGSYINNVFVDDDITIKQMQVPVDEIIYVDDATLAKYLLFATTDEQKIYVVQEGDTISSVAMKNKISTQEFLISNRQFSSESSLLFPGQEVVIGVTDPQIKVVVEREVREDVESQYSITERVDPERVIGDNEVIQKGENGLLRVSRLTTSVNGDVVNVEPIGENEVLKYPIEEVVVKGGKAVPNIGSLDNWAWPTNSGYMITSYYEWRISPISGAREFHTGLDIAGTGYRSPIYAANNGTVIEAGWNNGGWGNLVIIDHNNGYYTMYAHQDEVIAKVGDTVAKGQQIGYMGATGWATGVHCHYEVWHGGKWQRINPLSIYQ